MPSLGRIHVPDARDAQYPFSLHLNTLTAAKPKSKMWRAGRAKLDQGDHGYCVGFAGANWLQCLPIYTRVSNQIGINLYMECKKVDGDPNVEGTYDRALMKVLVGQGVVDRYLWAQTPEELRTWILTTGPVLVGTNWYTEMFDPSANGVVSLGGQVAGGHEYLVRGYDIKKQMYRCQNSWGKSWGINGEFWIKEADLNRLVFQEEGDACAAVQK